MSGNFYPTIFMGLVSHILVYIIVMWYYSLSKAYDFMPVRQLDPDLKKASHL